MGPVEAAVEQFTASQDAFLETSVPLVVGERLLKVIRWQTPTRSGDQTRSTTFQPLRYPIRPILATQLGQHQQQNQRQPVALPTRLAFVSELRKLPV